MSERYEKTKNINDLPNELLEEILNYLPEKQLFVVESVSKIWQNCVKSILALKKSLKKLNYYSKKFENLASYFGGEQNLIIHDKNIEILDNILTKYINIVHLDLSKTIIDGGNNLIAIANLCPSIQSINFDLSNINVIQNEMGQFGKLIGPQLKNCIFGNLDDNLMIFLKQLRNIEETDFRSSSCAQIGQLFRHLNLECNHLKSLCWNLRLIKSHCNGIYFDSESLSNNPECDLENFDFNNSDMINVIQRIKYLKIKLPLLLEFDFELNNLIEMTIYGYYSTNNRLADKTFANVTKLEVNNFNRIDFNSICKFKFPKLETVTLNSIDYSPGSNNNYNKFIIPESFMDQIKNIKQLTLNGYSYTFNNYNLLAVYQLDQLTQLTKLVWNDIVLKFCDKDDENAYVFRAINILSKHNTLINIQLTFNDNFMTINKLFYESLINLCEAKLNTKIVIKLEKSIQTKNNYNNYKLLFDKTKFEHKLNMELVFWETEIMYTDFLSDFQCYI